MDKLETTPRTDGERSMNMETGGSRRFLLHHTREGRPGICADDDPHPPVETQIIASLTFEDATALMDDMDETLADCLRRDGVVENEE